MSHRPRKQQRIDDGKDPAAARLQRVMSRGATSDSNLREIMGQLDGSTPSMRQTSHVRNAKLDSLIHILRVPIVKLKVRSEWEWKLCNPALLLTRVVAESLALQHAFKDALRRHPCSRERPWGLVVGFDEHIPGNKLALQPQRKSMHLSFSFVELGGIVCGILLWRYENGCI